MIYVGWYSYYLVVWFFTFFCFFFFFKQKTAYEMRISDWSSDVCSSDLKLDIKPQINEGGEIKLTIRQEVSSIAGPVSNSSSELILNKREFQTTLTAQDGQILAIGGLLDDNERRTIERVPLLSDIPAEIGSAHV